MINIYNREETIKSLKKIKSIKIDDLYILFKLYTSKKLFNKGVEIIDDIIKLDINKNNILLEDLYFSLGYLCYLMEQYDS
uniref:Conserved hypothetical plastid protein n=1 Tax=Flintiella sanguinaria TaxID=101926 RepID=A0A1X9PUD9_9RHOD|nr:conserved hypothetical plastid protein [Flintiella sanguinaria]